MACSLKYNSYRLTSSDIAVTLCLCMHVCVSLWKASMCAYVGMCVCVFLGGVNDLNRCTYVDICGFQVCMKAILRVWPSLYYLILHTYFNIVHVATDPPRASDPPRAGHPHSNSVLPADAAVLGNIFIYPRVCVYCVQLSCVWSQDALRNYCVSCMHRVWECVYLSVLQAAL